VPDLSEDAVRELYAVPPDEFMVKRSELAARAREAGDAAAAATIGKLRKPTVAAWLVNALVLSDPSVVDRLAELGDRLRDAQGRLDTGRLRQLSAERREVVDRLTAQAFRRNSRAQPPAALRDEVTGTFDAAIADPEVASRLGRLQRAEHWSGFGFLPTDGAPDLTLVRGGKPERSKPAAGTSAQKAQAPKRTAAEQRRLANAVEKSRAAFEAADAAADEARAAEQELSQEVHRLTKRLAKLQGELHAARARLEQARKDATTARTQRRQAQSALDKAERAAQT